MTHKLDKLGPQLEKYVLSSSPLHFLTVVQQEEDISARPRHMLARQQHTHTPTHTHAFGLGRGSSSATPCETTKLSKNVPDSLKGLVILLKHNNNIIFYAIERVDKMWCFSPEDSEHTDFRVCAESDKQWTASADLLLEMWGRVAAAADEMV